MNWVASTVRAIGTAARHLLRNRGFAVGAVANLGLGIAATAVVFSAAETLLLRPLPYPESDRLIALRIVDPVREDASGRVPPGLLADWQIKASSFEAIAGYRWSAVDLIDGDESEQLSGLLATPEFFEVFGVPLLGRSFRAEDRGSRRPIGGSRIPRSAWNEGCAGIAEARPAGFGTA